MNIYIRPRLLRKACLHTLLDLNHFPRIVPTVVGFVLGVVIMVIVDVALLYWEQYHTSHGIPALGHQSLSGDHVQRLLSDIGWDKSKGDDRLAIAVAKKVRVLCWVMIRQSQNIKARALRNTWGQRCDILLFFGKDPEFSAIDLDVKEGKRFLVSKTFASLNYIYKHHINAADWFLKADDDTYVIMENLKYFLSDEDPNSPVHFGEYFNPYGSKFLHYNSGGAGYVMSREALRRYGEDGPRTSLCLNPGGAEDKAISDCLLNLGVKIGETRDRLGKTRFHYDQVAWRAVGNYRPWYRHYVGGRYTEGIESISTYPISFHYLNNYDLYMLDYIVYRLRPYGITKAIPEVNK